ncbi:hypothetical protein [Streptomyces sp. DH37]|uniref:hypothetical protein n=1 Tax=Streptomyces sp. DH37 TaxID=3040122 RepID=UPI002441221B|nr:hypothetical protein [Streptomyces sp. DH37]MDG9701894.1 hypothetical protein [Streptomyces sp. DH37]
MTMTTDDPAPSGAFPRPATGVRVLDVGTGRPARALPRREGGREPRRWAEVGDLRSAP